MRPGAKMWLTFNVVDDDYRVTFDGMDSQDMFTLAEMLKEKSEKMMNDEIEEVAR